MLRRLCCRAPRTSMWWRDRRALSVPEGKEGPPGVSISAPVDREPAWGAPAWVKVAKQLVYSEGGGGSQPGEQASRLAQRIGRGRREGHSDRREQHAPRPGGALLCSIATGLYPWFGRPIEPVAIQQRRPRCGLCGEPGGFRERFDGRGKVWPHRRRLSCGISFDTRGTKV